MNEASTWRADPSQVLTAFREQNARHEDICVLHLGDRGFAAEITTVARAMIYAVSHQLQLVLESTDFAYRFDVGWTDYFEPFCPDYSPAMESRVAIRVMFRRHGVPNLANEAGGFDDLEAHHPESLRLGAFEFTGFDQMMDAFMRALFRLNRQTRNAVRDVGAALALPERYVALHIRRGDKVGDEDVFYPSALYVERLEPLAPDMAVFVMSDDQWAVRELEHHLAERGRANPVYSLLTDEHMGFDIRKVRSQGYFFSDSSEPVSDASYRRYAFRETVRLLSEISVAARSERFVSTFGSNVGRTVRWLHDRPQTCFLLRATSELHEATALMQRAFRTRQPLLPD